MNHFLIDNKHKQLPVGRVLTAVLEVSKTINLALDLESMFQLLAEKISTLMGFDCAVILLNPDDLELTWVGKAGLSDAYIQAMNDQHTTLASPNMSRGATGRAYRTRQPVQITDLNESSVSPWRDAARQEGIEAFIATPMVLHERVLGFINCYSRSPYEFSQDEIELLSIVGNQAAIAVEAARLHDEARQRSDALTQLTLALAWLNDTLRRQHFELLHAGQIHRELTEVILQDAGLDAIAARISGLINYPIVVCDADLRPLAVAGDDQLSQLLSKHDVALEELPRMLVSSKSSSNDAHSDATSGRSVRLNQRSIGDPSITCLYLPVTAGGSTLGYLIAVETPGTMGELDLRAIEYGGTVVALELLKQRAVIQAEQELRGGFLDDLLSGEFESTDAIVRRATYLGFDFSRSYRVLTIGIDEADSIENSNPAGARVLDERRQQIRGRAISACSYRWPGSIVTVRGDSVVIVWPEDILNGIDLRGSARILKNDLVRGLRGVTVSVGIGSPCQEPESFARSYSEAHYCLQIAQRFKNHGVVLSIEQLGINRFLIRPNDSDALLEFAHQRLESLIQHEIKHGGDLLKTLNTYFHTECSLTRTAERLAIHINTVQYRLRRVEELTGVNLRLPEGLMEIQLALLVASLQPSNSSLARCSE